ncbi:hypothetical protein DV735_g3917, partial [Chaetothyriales sp. CBS 134920]
MEALTEAELATIEKYPLSDSIYEHAATLLQDNPDLEAAGPPQNPTLFVDTMQHVLATLMASPASSHLASRIGREPWIKLLQPLSYAVIEKAPATQIWATVIGLVSAPASRPSGTHLREETPVTVSSNSLQGREQTRDLVRDRVLDEFRFCTFENVPGFHDKYFTGSKKWNKKINTIWKDVTNSVTNTTKHNGERWTGFPHPPKQDDVLEWFFRLQDNLLGEARHAYYKSTLTYMTNAESKRRADLIVKARDPNAQHEWKDVLVVGELKQSNYDWKGTLLQLGCYVRDLMASQPTRRFVHAFALYGSVMECWIFDRSGPYRSGQFSIHEEPKRFIQVMCGYAMMSDKDLGLDTFIKGGKAKMSISLTLEPEKSGKKLNLELDPQPIAHQRAIVCRGTTCYLAKKRGRGAEWDYVVKFSWVSDKRQPEANLLMKAQEHGIKGVARLVAHQQLDSVGALRQGLDFKASKLHKFHGMHANQLLTYSHSPSHGMKTLTIEDSPKRRKLNAGRPSKNSPSGGLQGTLKGMQGDVQEASNSSLMKHNTDIFDNRILSVLVISPAGRAIRLCTSPVELVASLHDAIKAHRALYMDAKILHRDISENNIIITNAKGAEDPKGMLIDLDLAKVVDAGRSGARHRTGTMEFMAVGVLSGHTHTYRHDLESFFYVLIWLSARRAWDLPGAGERPVTSQLTDWYIGSYAEIARRKRGQMEKKGFEDLLREIAPAFADVKELCRRLRDHLFPYEADGLFTDTPNDPDSLYLPILAEFSDALSTIQPSALPGPTNAPMAITVGVLALQGAFVEHLSLLQKAGEYLKQSGRVDDDFSFVQVRNTAQLRQCDGLIIPGGESTTMSLVAADTGLLEPLRSFVKIERKPTFGTCAGLILLSETAAATKQGGQELIGGLDVQVNRNHFGRQVQSFKTELDLPFLARGSTQEPFPGVFIRAPVVDKVLAHVDGEQSSPVEIMGTLPVPGKEDGIIIAVKQGNVFGTSFHPEMTSDVRIHAWWLEQVVKATAGQR